MTPPPPAGRDEAASRPEASGAPVPEPTVSITRYEVSCLPEGHPDRYLFALAVEKRHGNRWAVMSRGFCFDADGNMEYESIPSDRTDKFKARFRHSHDEALALAKRLAPTLRINQYTVADVLRIGADR